MTAHNEIEPTEFDNVQVIAIPEKNPTTGEVTYRTTFIPESIVITTNDCVINYQLISPTPDGVQFTGMSINPKHTHQLSTPSISRSGRIMTFSDANTLKEVLHITLHFTDKDQVEFSVDPDVENDPPPAPPTK